jgi:hypothetical protein
MARPQLRLVTPADARRDGDADEEKPCVVCAFVVVFLLMGLLWWPIFHWWYT